MLQCLYKEGAIVQQDDWPDRTPQTTWLEENLTYHSSSEFFKMLCFELYEGELGD